MLRTLALAGTVAAAIGISSCSSPDAASAPSASPSHLGATPIPAPVDDGAGPAPVGPLDPGSPGVPPGAGASVDDVLRLGGLAVWGASGTEVIIAVPAAPGCPPAAHPPIVDDGTLVVQVERAPECEAPSEVRTFAIGVPAGVDTSDGLPVVLRDRVDLLLPMPAPTP